MVFAHADQLLPQSIFSGDVGKDGMEKQMSKGRKEDEYFSSEIFRALSRR